VPPKSATFHHGKGFKISSDFQVWEWLRQMYLGVVSARRWRGVAYSKTPVKGARFCRRKAGYSALAGLLYYFFGYDKLSEGIITFASLL
jgi:hypothetical protein